MNTNDLADYEAEQRRSDQLCYEFVQHHGVTEFQNAAHNVAMLLRTSGADPEVIRRVKKLICSTDGGLSSFGVFDHPGIYGRDRKPLILVGHPYSIDEDGEQALDLIRGIGLEVKTDGRSFYGFGTSQVLVFAKGFVHPEGVLS